MTAELGLVFLIMALLCALLQAAYLWPNANLKLCISRCLSTAAWLQALLVALALATLITLRLNSDFSVANVIAHSNLHLPTLYKIVGAWGNHEGSMLLWVLVLSVFGAGVAVRPMPDNPLLKCTTLAVQALFGAGFLSFVLFTSNPFERRFPPTIDGEALNPLLQDVALAIHPPLLYTGYVGFSVVFSFAVAALLLGRMDRRWAHAAHPWILISWSALTLGIGLGSWWAYRVLGWGGFWFWDPVENASLLPWLSGTALMHANIVLKKRGKLAQWVALLAIITFGLSMLGTFLVRSGLLTSVHSFASDPQRGLYILSFIGLTLGGALALFAVRAGAITRSGEGEALSPLSREGMIILNNLFILTACATVLLGTLYPLMMEFLSGDKITVGPAYYRLTFLPLMAAPLIGAGIAPFLPWGQSYLRGAAAHLRPALLACLGVGILTLATVHQQAAMSAFGLALSAWLLVSSVQWLRTRGTSGASLPVFLGHTGAAIIVLGLTGAGLWDHSAEGALRVGDKLEVSGYTLRFERFSREETPNYTADIARLRVISPQGNDVATLFPEYRTYAIRGTGINTVDIYTRYFTDIYAVIGETAEGRTIVRAYTHPLMIFVWIGCIITAAGAVAALHRRYR